MSKYPYCPRTADVFWDNGKWVAIVTDDKGIRRNVATYNCNTKRQAILDARAHLGYEIDQYRDEYC